jgi:hypothetical protein
MLKTVWLFRVFVKETHCALVPRRLDFSAAQQLAKVYHISHHFAACI